MAGAGSGGGQRRRVSVPSFLERRGRGPGVLLGDTSTQKVDSRRLWGHSLKGQELFDLCRRQAFCGGVGVRLDPGPDREHAGQRGVRVRARALVRVCVGVRAPGEAYPRIRIHPRAGPACVPEPHVLPLLPARSGGEGTAPLKGSPPSESWTPPPPPPARWSGGEDLFSFITFSFSFLSVNYLFSALGSERRGRAPPQAPRCGGAVVQPQSRAFGPGPRRPLCAQVRTGAVYPPCGGLARDLWATSVGTQTGFGESTATLRI